MKKLLPILVLLGACAPDIQQDPAPSTDVVMVNFDPAHVDPATGEPDAIVPLPNDLARADATTGEIAPGAKIKVPPPPSSRPYPDAQKEFDQQYLQTLDGFPYESTASVTTSGDLNPTSVNPMTILAFDITNKALPMPVTIAPTFANKTITIPPPAGNWTRAHTYAIAAIGGANGLKGAGGQPVIGSQVWTLVSSSNPLVTCPDLKTNCQPAVDIIPSTQTDPDAKLKDQTAKAIQLEQLRRGYAPILDALGNAPFNHPRSDIPIVWTFTIVDAGEVTFDPAKSVIPFPNDLVRTGPKKCGTKSDRTCINVPNPTTGAPLTFTDCQTATGVIALYCGLNTLDGFSTLAPLISENSDKAGAVDQALIDDKSLNPMSVGLVRLASDAPAPLQTTPKYTPCINCTSSPKADGTPQTSPQQLQWRLDVPLDEMSSYFAYVSNGVKDTTGKPVVANPVFALVRSSASLVDANGHTTVNLITDDQAKQLEPVRVGFKAAFDGLEKAGIHRTDLALAFPFTTQTESTFLDKLTGVPAQAKLLGLPDFPIATQKATTAYFASMDAAVPAVKHDAIADIYAGAILTPVAVTGASGTFNPDPTKVNVLPVRFTLTIPTGTPPAGGWPVTIFNHGFGRYREDALLLANSYAAQGQAVISTDVLFHGERTSCTGVKTFLSKPDDAAACADPTTMKCDEGFQGLCVLRDDAARATCVKSLSTDPSGDGFCTTSGQGRCAADGKCQGTGADFLRAPDAGDPAPVKAPAISGWNIFFPYENFFATRDKFRQQVIDLSQLVAVLKSTDAKKLGNQLFLANGNVPVPLDATKVNFTGQSLGGILGTLFNSVSPDTNNVVLNVSGGNLIALFLNSPRLAAGKAALIQTLGAGGVNPGTPAFDQFLATAQWILDEADPANMAYRLTHPVDVGNGVTAPNANRKVFFQFIEGDDFVPNIANLAEVAAANRDFVATPPSFGCKPPLFCYEFTEKGDMFDTTSAPINKRHGFLLADPSAAGAFITTKAQTQAAKFVATGNFQ